MMSHLYKEEKVCECGYTTLNRGSWSLHTNKRCKLRKNIESGDKERIASLERDKEDLKEQLATKDEQMKAKDRQIDQLIKRPRMVNNNTTNKYVVEQKINVFGKESTDHISPEQIQALLADPANAVPQFIKLKHRKAPGGVNQNLRIPNQKRAIYQVVVSGEDADKEWENKAKGEVLEQLYDDNSGHLEAEADEETRVGSRFLDHQDRVKSSACGEDGGRRYKDQLDKIHCVISS